MKTDFHVHDAIRVEYRVATNAAAFPKGYAHIERETRCAGGNGVIAACALARWGASVLLTGNPIGDDEHGRFLVRELEKVPNLRFEPQIEPGFVTPYAILLKAGSHEVGTLMSPTAAPLSLEKRPQNPDVAGFFFGDPASFTSSDSSSSALGETGAMAVLRAQSQDYGALLGSLEAVTTCYLSLLGQDVETEEKSAFVSYVMEHYKEAFSGPDSIPSLEEIEASLGQGR